MKFINVLVISTLLACAPTCFIGCAPTPVGRATRVVATTAQTVDAAMESWADYVVAEEIRISKLDHGERLALRDDLLRKEGAVATAHGEYREALLASVAALKAARNGAPLPANVSALGLNVLRIIKERKP